MPRKFDQSTTASQKSLYLLGILLFSKRAYSLKKIADKLRYSRQTVLRIIEEIESTHTCKIKKWTSDRQNWYQAGIHNLPTPLPMTVAE